MGWLLLARHRAGRITYVLKDEHGEMDFNTIDEVQAAMRKMQKVRKLPPFDTP